MSAYTSQIETPGALADASSIRCRKILVSVPTGFQLRQFVYSGVIDRLVDNGCKVLIATPGMPERGFGGIEDKPGVSFRAINAQLGRIGRRYFLARQHLLLNYAASETLQQKMKRLRETHPSSAFFAAVLRALLSHVPGLRRHFLNREHLLLSHPETEALIREERPDLVLLGSPGFVPQDAVLQHTAKKYRIPVATAVLSWDNLSSKGLINPEPDRLLVWSKYMGREAVDLHGFDPNRIYETGAVIYDAFANATLLGSKAEHLRRLGLDPNRKLIFYGTNHGGLFGSEIAIVRQVAEWVENDAFGEPCQLWIRLHPQAVSGPFAVDTDAYRRLESQKVHVEFPPVRDSKMLWELPKADLEHLIRILRDSDVVINVASTISLDAAVLDRPIVCPSYDPEGVLPYHRSIRRFYGFNHMAHVVQSGSVRLAASPGELRNNIQRYLEQPELDREGRRRIVEQQFGAVDGRSVDRTVDAILEMLAEKGKM